MSRFYRVEHLGLEQQPGQAEPLDRILLHHRTTLTGKNVRMSPTKRATCGADAPRRAILAEPRTLVGVVQGAEGRVDPRIIAGQRHFGAVRGA